MPSVCAGLRQTLLHGYGRGFPLDPSPFQRMALATGATPRELLQQCKRLQDQDLLDGLGVVWSEVLKRQRWRVGLPGATAQQAARVARSLPGIVALEHWTHTQAAELPTLWCWLDAHDLASARAQAAALRLDLGLGELPVLPLRQVDDPCDCGRESPCADRELAEALEGGLPLCAHPYGALAERLGRPERELRNRLRRWQELDLLAGIGLQAHLVTDHQPMQGLLLPEALPNGWLAPAGVEALAWPLQPGWAYSSELRWHGATERPELRRSLLAAGADLGRARTWSGLHQPVRREALLFSELQTAG